MMNMNTHVIDYLLIHDKAEIPKRERTNQLS